MSGINTAVNRLLNDLGLRDFQLERIRAGRNSRVWRVDSYAGVSYIIKEYFRHPSDPRDRLSTEYEFLAFLQSQGVSSVPLPLSQDKKAQAALYSYLPGDPVKSIQPYHIQQAAQFIQRVNQARWAALTLPPASEACFSLEEHLQRVQERLKRLQSALGELIDPWQRAAHHLLTHQVDPTYQQVAQRLRSSLSAATLTHSLEQHQRILSPSDFGFHNMLEMDGILSFLDFEYAGWDDPAKLICDFASQPQCPVSSTQSELFGVQLGEWFPEAQERANLLLPLHRLKWCCILLNEFQSHNRQRRYHAGDSQAERLETQLHKAQSYFDQHCQLD